MRFYFLLRDIGLRYSGIEASSILRANLFCNQLGVFPFFITSKYRSFHNKDFLDLQRVGKVNKKLVNINVYDVLQGIDRKSKAKIAKYYFSDDECEAEVPGYMDKKVFDSEGGLSRYIVYHKKYNLLHFINHFKNRKKWRRDYYDSLGFLSSTQYISDDVVSQHVFYRENGSLALIKNYSYFDGELDKVEIQILNERNELVKVVYSEEDLAFHALSILLKEGGGSLSLIIDRNMFYYSISVKLKSMLARQGKKVFLIPVIHNMHVINSKNNIKRINRNYRKVFEEPALSDAVITQTKKQEVDISEDYKYLNVFSIPHSYNARIKEDQVVNRDFFKAIYLGRYSFEKKHDLAIRAFEIVVKTIPNARLYCYGFGPTLPDLKELVSLLGLEKNVFLYEWLENVSAEYLSAGLSLITSQSESFSLTIAESLAHGCPVVAFDVPYGPRELIEDGWNGYLVPYSDVESMAQKVINIMKDKKLQLKLSEQAFLSSSRYSEKIVGNRWKDLFFRLGINYF